MENQQDINTGYTSYEFRRAVQKEIQKWLAGYVPPNYVSSTFTPQVYQGAAPLALSSSLGFYWAFGNIVYVNITVVLNAAGSANTDIRLFGWPSTYNLLETTARSVGGAKLWDASASREYWGSSAPNGANGLVLRSGVNVVASNWGATASQAPVTLAANDDIGAWGIWRFAT